MLGPKQLTGMPVARNLAVSALGMFENAITRFKGPLH